MKYRKKPVVVEAYQTTKPLDIQTLEGTMHANAGDWIITGVKGERYPCKPDIFAATYEPAVPAPKQEGRTCGNCGLFPKDPSAACNCNNFDHWQPAASDGDLRRLCHSVLGDYFLGKDEEEKLAKALLARAPRGKNDDTSDTEANGYPLTEARLERDEWRARFEAECEVRRNWAIRAEAAEAERDEWRARFEAECEVRRNWAIRAESAEAEVEARS